METEAQLEEFDQEAIQGNLERANERLDSLVADVRSVDAELEELGPERAKYDLLRQACEALTDLSAGGDGDLFWGERLAGEKGDEFVRRARERLDGFQVRLDEITGRRQVSVDEIHRIQESIEVLEEELFEAQEEEERRRLEWIVEREIGNLPARQSVMPWARGDDDARFRKTLGITLLVSLFLGILLPLVDLPLPDPWEAEDVPERLARLVTEKRPPPPPPAAIETQPEVKPPEPEEPEPEAIEEPVELTDQPVLAEEATPQQVPQSPEPKRAQTKGLMAFKEKFSTLAAGKPSAQLGADARISNGGDEAVGRPERSMVTSQAPGSSGGINLASLSRNVGGGGDGGGLQAGVQLTRAESTIGGSGGPDRPLASGAGAGRTDEEIQIVFDRHKAALYRLYNRQLRQNPTLQGQMVLRLRIEPDGSVSLCELQQSDMNAPALSEQVLARVRTFDFGAKDVPAVTILYPIDFLPAT